MITLTQKLPASSCLPVSLVLQLTADERSRSRHRFETVDQQIVLLQLPRGTVLRNGDLLQSEAGQVVQVSAKPEPVLTVRADTEIELLRAAYHLGNRHVPLEIAPSYLRLSPDSVLHDLLKHRGLLIVEEVQPFQPELGAYGHHH